MEDSNTYSLNNSNNYNYILLYSSTLIFKIYVDILNCYINEFNNSNSIQLIHTKNINLYCYLCDQGVNTISYIFKILLKNTKNIDLVKYYCTKSINYYIEFIEQNNRHAEDKIRYAHASLFSYRNTIYNINKSYIKSATNILDENVAYIMHTNQENEMILFKNVELFIDIYIKQINCYASTTQNASATQNASPLSENITFISNLIALYQDNDSLCDVNFNLEKGLNHKLNFVKDFITLTPIISINLLLTHVKERRPIMLNKAILLKKLLNKKEKFKNEEEYITWLLA